LSNFTSNIRSGLSERRQKKRGGSLSQVNQENSEEDHIDIPKARIPDDEALEAKTQESGNESIANEVDKMMKELELEGWHLVSREEVEEAVEVGNARI
jgi:N-methylhydantoinase B/oxoprolinase/acetone carboxylase alpha subunit